MGCGRQVGPRVGSAGLPAPGALGAARSLAHVSPHPPPLLPHFPDFSPRSVSPLFQAARAPRPVTSPNPPAFRVAPAGNELAPPPRPSLLPAAPSRPREPGPRRPVPAELDPSGSDPSGPSPAGGSWENSQDTQARQGRDRGQ